MRIVHLGTSLLPIPHRRGGALERRILEMARLQAAAGHEVVVLSPGARGGVDELDGVQIHNLRLYARRPARDYEFLARARAWARHRPRADVLHAHGSPVAAAVLGDRFTATVHSVDWYTYRWTARRLPHRYYQSRLAAFDVHLAASEYCAAGFRRFYPRVAPRTGVLYNGVNRRQFRRDPRAAEHARDRLGLPAGPLVVYLGRVCAQKGSDLLAPLATHLRGVVPEATVVAAGPGATFAGDGPSRLAADLSAAGVHCLGAIDEDLVAGLLAAAAVAVLPTRHDEMFGMAALEAVACGTPVVAADLGGIPEAVGPCALLFPPGDAHAFAAAVTRVLTEPGLADRLAAGVDEHVARFDWAAVVDEAMTHYDRVLDD
ncbi:glycosyltransferase family 4 protein [Actinoplanes sp. N902-109]|uniref:glycosyltransferase family 4 protein n=1 Tax=Actinoplanes sp. (strain N902-109) TaxID=649831 RepID=UPI0003293BD4|nr:glycosyltransferase family 4 protein [Actinoplanes sp. N902-109]AGL16324.1 glycosyl transferase family protein [Actinoplanes sp. N902-109]